MKGHISVYTNNIDEKQSEMLKYFEKVETDEVPKLTDTSSPSQQSAFGLYPA